MGRSLQLVNPNLHMPLAAARSAIPNPQSPIPSRQSPIAKHQMFVSEQLSLRLNGVVGFDGGAVPQPKQW